MKTFTTPKGTVLPLADLKGKDYLLVPHRVQWFREEHPNWAITTDITNLDDKFCIVRAKILDERQNILATAHKREDKSSFADYMEKAETGAIGRALALCGYGTQFATDLLEGDRLADSPLVDPGMREKKEIKNYAPSVKSIPSEHEPIKLNKVPDEDFFKDYQPTPEADKWHGTGKNLNEPEQDAFHGELETYVIKFGKDKGKRLVEMDLSKMESYIAWLEKNAKETKKPLSASAQELKSMVALFAKEQELPNLEKEPEPWD